MILSLETWVLESLLYCGFSCRDVDDLVGVWPIRKTPMGISFDSLFVNCRSPIFEFVFVVSCCCSGLVFLCLGQNELSDSQMIQSSILLLVVQFVFCNNNQSQYQFSHVISNNKIIIHIILFIYIMKSLSQF